jgi:anti-sigma regulatory factor (Ser/Thr protein kinase)
MNAAPAGEIRVACSSAALAGVRDQVRATLSDEGCSEPRTRAAVLATSEIVTNAIRHASPPIDVLVELIHDGVRIGVTDHAPDVLPAVSLAPGDAGGFGLRLVGLVADRWGILVEDDHKTVWAEIGARARDF